MPKNNIKSKKGFTIIEVVLVLAIAGLIFLMVFIALPAMQRSQRDTQRRNDYSMLSSAITSYSASNGGNIYKLARASKITASSCTTRPGFADTIAANSLDPATYINKTGMDPNGYRYQLRACTFVGWNSLPTIEKTPLGVRNGNNGSEVFVILGANCNGTENGHDAPAQDSSSRAFAIYGYLESGSGTYCSASQ